MAFAKYSYSSSLRNNKTSLSEIYRINHYSTIIIICNFSNPFYDFTEDVKTDNIPFLLHSEKTQDSEKIYIMFRATALLNINSILICTV